MIAQRSETSSEGDSSSYGNEETRTPSNMGNDKLMEVIVLPGGDKDSGATIPAETVLDSTTGDDWKVPHAGLMQKTEDCFNEEAHTLIMKLTDNAEQHTLKGPSCCFESVPNTELQFSRQSM